MTVRMISHILNSVGWEVLASSNLTEAKHQLELQTPDIAIVDVFLGEEDGLSYVSELRERYPEMGIVVISAEDTESLANKATRSGSDYFLSKPIAPTALSLTIQKLDELKGERERANILAQDMERSLRDNIFPEILTHSDSMKAALRLVEKVSPKDLSVLIFGESGTGKELIARAVHHKSSRSKNKFIELNCAALPPNLVESELFGHEKGAFTGAVNTRPGKIELAHGGTLFLDEIGELPLEIQPKLLRALQEKRVTRVGGKTDIKSDFRLVSATHRDLLKEVKKGDFREDLFYRVAVFPIKLPPLRHRIEDLELLLKFFLDEEGVGKPSIPAAAMELLKSYRWPGNIRELKNFAQAIPLLTDKNEIDERSIRNYFGTRLNDPLDGGSSSTSSSSAGKWTIRTDYSEKSESRPSSPVPAPKNGKRPVKKLEVVEREEIEYALECYNGNVPEAAMALGMGRATLYKYIKKNDIDLKVFGS